MAVERAGMASSDVIAGIDLTDDTYHVAQSLIRNKFKVTDTDGNLVLRAKQKLFKMKEEFPFVDADGTEVFTVKAEGILDVAGDYTIVEAGTDDPIAVLGKNFTLLKHEWTVKDPETNEVWAEIESRSAVVELLRGLLEIFSLLPHKYTIETPAGGHVGSIEGKLSIRDRYDIHIDDPGDVPREALVAAAIAVDALEGN
jgi:uncharacterized protein YxjI